MHAFLGSVFDQCSRNHDFSFAWNVEYAASTAGVALKRAFEASSGVFDFLDRPLASKTLRH